VRVEPLSMYTYLTCRRAPPTPSITSPLLADRYPGGGREDRQRTPGRDSCGAIGTSASQRTLPTSSRR
jgi:hypothetical protein